MAPKRADHKRFFAAWIDFKILEAIRAEAKRRGCTTAELLESMAIDHLGAKPSGQQAAASGLPRGKQRADHGSWRRK
jgi:hypothetical protein